MELIRRGRLIGNIRLSENYYKKISKEYIHKGLEIAKAEIETLGSMIKSLNAIQSSNSSIISHLSQKLNILGTYASLWEDINCRIKVS